MSSQSLLYDFPQLIGIMLHTIHCYKANEHHIWHDEEKSFLLRLKQQFILRRTASRMKKNSGFIFPCNCIINGFWLKHKILLNFVHRMDHRELLQITTSLQIEYQTPPTFIEQILKDKTWHTDSQYFSKVPLRTMKAYGGGEQRYSYTHS